MGVVWQKWAWFGKSGRGHAKFFAALRARTLLKEPPFLNSWIRPCVIVGIKSIFNHEHGDRMWNFTACQIKG